ncbi:MAG: hypothetical protein MUF42_08795 [Cytophagaceae bacterium]|jgi:hypothetical protein|nr:hypothetical protein [Cytophagaceae bacterium]
MIDLEVETRHAFFKLVDGVLITTFKPKNIDLETAKQIVEDRKRITHGKSYPGMGYAKGIKYVSKEAREYFSQPEALEGVLAGALIMDSNFSAGLINFFLKLTSPKIPNKAFSSEQAAIEWLQQFKAE